MLTEGLLVYLDSETVAALARDLHAVRACRWWLCDLVSPDLLRMAAEQRGRQDTALAGAVFRFAPESTAGWFGPHGWREAEFRSTVHEGIRLQRTPPLDQLLCAVATDQGAEPEGADPALFGDRTPRSDQVTTSSSVRGASRTPGRACHHAASPRRCSSSIPCGRGTIRCCPGSPARPHLLAPACRSGGRDTAWAVRSREPASWLMRATRPAQSGEAALVPAPTTHFPCTKTRYPVNGSAFDATSGTPRPR